MRRKGIIVLLILPMIIALPAFFVDPSTSNAKETILSDLTVHEPILITNDSNFTDYGFGGNGTISNPYEITNLSIVVIWDYYVPTEMAISIRDTAAYFTISNCNLSAEYGVNLYNVKDNTAAIENNYFYNCSRSIKISSSNGVQITNNTCIDEGPIILMNAENCNITENKVSGVILEDSNNNFVSENEFVGDISSLFSTGITLSVTSISFGPSDFDELFFDNNTLNGDPILIYQSIDNILINTINFSQLILMNCFNATIENINFTDVSVKLYHCFNSSIKNNEKVNIYLGKSEFSQINNNTNVGILTDFSNDCKIESNRGWINARSSPRTIISGNNCSNQYIGIKLFGSIYSIVENNYCYNNTIGINRITNYCIIRNNTIVSSRGTGMSCDGNNVNITSNQIINNNGTGLSLIQANFNLIRNNTLANNSDYGIYIDWHSNNNSIYHNVFINNNPDGEYQACDYGDNFWYDTESLTGNYWNNYSGVGSYSILGSVDPHPLLYYEGYPTISEYKNSNALLILIFGCLFYLVSKKRKSNLPKVDKMIRTNTRPFVDCQLNLYEDL